MTKLTRITLSVCAAVAGLAMTLGAAQAADVAAGKVLYADNCMKCHGAKGQGGIGLKLAGDAAYWDADIFDRAVLTGINDEGKKLKAPMPVFGKIGLTLPKGKVPTTDDLANIQAYIQTFAPKDAS